jgi:kynurenine 3-monooxygenase
LSELYPNRYQPLYSMIAFTCMPYADALTIDQEQRLQVDEIMSTRNIGPQWSQEQIDAVIDNVMQTSVNAAGVAAQAQA